MSGLAGKLLTIVQQRTGLPRLWSDLRTGPIRGWKRNRPQGKIERIEGGSVVGWLWNPAIPEQAMEFRLLVNGVDAGVFVADRLRLDLRAKGMGTGKHAFSVPIPQKLLRTGVNRASLASAGDKRALSQTFEFRHGGRGGASRARAATPGPKLIGSGRDFGEPSGLPQIIYASNDPADRADALIFSKRQMQSVFGMMVSAVDQRQMKSLVSELFKRKEWDLVILACSNFARRAMPNKLMGLYGRALLNANRIEEAAQVLLRLRDLDPEDHANIFHLGIAFARLQRWPDAVEVFEYCISLSDREARYFHEAGRAYLQIGFGSYGAVRADRSALDKAGQYLERALKLDQSNWRPCRELAELLVHLGDLQKAYQVALMGTQRGAKEAGAFTELARVCTRMHKIPEAAQAARRALELDPNGDSTKVNFRLLTRLFENARSEPSDTIAIVAGATELARVSQLPANVALVRADSSQGIRDVLAATEATWIVPDGPSRFSLEEIRNAVDRFGFVWSAGIRLEKLGEPLIWRREFLQTLLTAGAVGKKADMGRLMKEALALGAFSTTDTALPEGLDAQLPRSRTVLLLSQHGIRKFGGGEHFLHQMAGLYRDLGFDVVIVGPRAEQPASRGELDGFRFASVDRTPDSLLRLAIEERPILVHVISGLAFDVITALRFLNIKVVHGIHFWRDMLANPTPSSGYYPEVDQQSTPRQEFHAVIQDVDVTYSNSLYTQAQVEKHFGVRTPIMFSLPDDVEVDWANELGPAARDFVLLANVRADKGFDLVVEVARRLPHIRFCAIASQSSRDVAASMFDAAEVTNIDIIDHVADMSELYRKARVVVVPSYRFIETFSRVVIEAHRFGVPVIGSDRGNVPLLLTESGISLPEDAAAWADELQRLFSDEAYWQHRSQLARENSERYAFKMQKDRLVGMISSAASPILVGVGSGLGNIIHTTPLVRNLARRLGRRVDVVVAGDHQNMLFLLENTQYVNHVFALNEDLVRRRYDLVFLTHCFGKLTPKFSASCIINSREWSEFTPEHPFHEAEYNLAAAKALLNVPYAPEDVLGYFIGEVKYVPPKEQLVGFHAGSKGGKWSTKRWPHFQELARLLAQRGIKAASFGVSDEYVPGTIDMTGGTIEEMTKKMLLCSHFVANDSGGMNLANGLGIPLVALFAPTNPRTRGPLAPTSVTIAVERPCAPCEVHPVFKMSRFVPGECDCIAQIEVSTVLDALIEMMQSETPPAKNIPAPDVVPAPRSLPAAPAPRPLEDATGVSQGA